VLSRWSVTCSRLIRYLLASAAGRWNNASILHPRNKFTPHALLYKNYGIPLELSNLVKQSAQIHLTMAADDSALGNSTRTSYSQLSMQHILESTELAPSTITSLDFLMDPERGIMPSSWQVPRVCVYISLTGFVVYKQAVNWVFSKRPMCSTNPLLVG